MKYCPKCGNPVEDSYSFCSKCGTKVETPAAPADQQNRNTAPVFTPTAPMYQQYGYDHNRATLDALHKKLGNEKTSYLVLGIISIVSAVLTLFLALIMIPMGNIVSNTLDDPSYYFGSDYDFDIDYNFDDDYFFDDDSDNYGDDEFMLDDNMELDSEFVTAAFIGYAVVFIFSGAMSLAGGIICLVQSSKIGRIRENMYVDCTDAVKYCHSNGILALLIVLTALFWLLHLITLIFHINNRSFVNDNSAAFDALTANQKSNSGIQH